eukprot:CAMPEP_0176202544 /NCGR_PEP_ID=MMETSP0121_2-20121125/10125_1 /TAXON_ID=160619 /ORGANISM="Kryptoperidinium foliaceum, Strain CCMP 1326" /LENGTH=89 /DNA_ID=CAMNT_0017541433 /DNA_START=87 /DNA_END=352 /DNA_ORIENTATION=+
MAQIRVADRRAPSWCKMVPRQQIVDPGNTARFKYVGARGFGLGYAHSGGMRQAALDAQSGSTLKPKEGRAATPRHYTAALVSRTLGFIT